MGPMGAPTSLPPDEAAFQKLAQDLRRKTTTKPIVKCLKAVAAGLEDFQTEAAVRKALAFLRAGGLPPIVWLGTEMERGGGIPRPDATDNQCPSTSAIKDESIRAFQALLKVIGSIEVLHVEPEDISPLLCALSKAPTMQGRSMGAHALLAVSDSQPHVIANGDAVNLVVAFYQDLGSIDLEFWDRPPNVRLAGPACAMLNVIIGCGTPAAHHLCNVILSPNAGKRFAALVVLQDCLEWGTVDSLSGLDSAGVPNALVDTLAHDSPFCVAAAAGALSYIGRARALGSADPEIIQRTDAIRSLVHLIETPTPPVGLDDTMGLVYRAIYRRRLDGQCDTLQFNNPTVLALSALTSFLPYNGPMLDSFLAAGGVHAVSHLMDSATSAVTLLYTLDMISVLLENICPHKGPDRRTEIANNFFKQGLFEHFRDVFSLSKDLRTRILSVLFMYLGSLSPHYKGAVLERLAASRAIDEIVCHVVKEGPDKEGRLLELLLMLVEGERTVGMMCSPGPADTLAEGVAKWLLEPEEAWLLTLPKLLGVLMRSCPNLMPAALGGIFTPGLINLLRRLCPGRPAWDNPADCILAVSLTHDCIKQLIEAAGRAGIAAFGEPAILGTCLSDLLMIEDKKVVLELLELSHFMLLKASVDGREEWARGLLRAIAGLIRAESPVAAHPATEMLYCIGLTRPEMLGDFHSWGLGDSLRQSTMHSDPAISGVAEALLYVADLCLGDPSLQLVLQRMVARDQLPPGFPLERLLDPKSRPHLPLYKVLHAVRPGPTPSVVPKPNATPVFVPIPGAPGSKDTIRANTIVNGDQEPTWPAGKPWLITGGTAPSRHLPGILDKVGGPGPNPSVVPKPDATPVFVPIPGAPGSKDTIRESTIVNGNPEPSFPGGKPELITGGTSPSLHLPGILDKVGGPGLNPSVVPKPDATPVFVPIPSHGGSWDKLWASKLSNDQQPTWPAGKPGLLTGGTAPSPQLSTIFGKGVGPGPNPSVVPKLDAAPAFVPIPSHGGHWDKLWASKLSNEPNWSLGKCELAPDGVSPADAIPARRRRPRRVWACAACGVTAAMLESGKLKECSGCGKVRYCGTACQKDGWPAHKAVCKLLQVARRG